MPPGRRTALPAIVVADGHSRIASPGPAKPESRFRDAFPQNLHRLITPASAAASSPKTAPVNRARLAAAEKTSQVFEASDVNAQNK